VTYHLAEVSAAPDRRQVVHLRLQAVLAVAQEEARSVFDKLLGTRQFLRIMTILDKAFAIRQSARYTKAPDSRCQLEVAPGGSKWLREPGFAGALLR
jgi:hypothetical protein